MLYRYVPALILALPLLAGCAQKAPPSFSAPKPRDAPGALAPEERTTPIGPASPAAKATGDLLERLRGKMKLSPHLQQDAVKKKIAQYRRKGDYLHRTMTRSQPYLYHILSEIENRGVPMELALLPVVESAFRPYAQSPKKAMGLWQFIPQTGKAYNLRQDWWYDGRRDPIEATRAALDYLQKLEREFEGDWLLALAGYNWGERNVRRAIRKNRRQGKPTDFWSLRVPRETRAYVPTWLAIAELIRRPDHYGLDLPKIPDRPHFAVLPLEGPVDLGVVAQKTGLKMEEIHRLNAGFRRWLSPPDGPHRILLPSDRASIGKQALAALPPQERLRWRRHRVQSGDTLVALAARYRLDAAVLADLNDLQHERPLAIGENLRIPVPLYPSKNYRSSLYRHAFSSPEPPPGRGRHLRYTVRKGDSLWSIGRRHGVSISQLRRWNPMLRGKYLHPGRKLTLWQPLPPAAAPEAPGGRHYTVRKNDSLWNIARNHNLKMQHLAQWNGLNTGRPLQPGQQLRLSPPESSARAKGADNPPVVRYLVRKGDSLWRIARQFNTSVRKLRAWNSLSRRHLQPGQKIIVRPGKPTGGT